MEHIWVEYENKYTIEGHRSFYCKNCNIKSFFMKHVKYRFTETPDILYNEISCEEYIIKSIIE